MAYNNGFPMNYGYQPIVQTPQVQQPTQPTSPLIWVQGEAGAKSYLVAANNTVPLWDSENQTIYLKSADASGMPSMKILDYTIRESAQNMPHKAALITEDIEYATKDEMTALKQEILQKFDALREEIGA